MPFAPTWTDLEMIILNEVRKRKTNTLGLREAKELARGHTARP